MSIFHILTLVNSLLISSLDTRHGFLNDFESEGHGTSITKLSIPKFIDPRLGLD